MIDPDDLEHCREVIRTGSLSFHAASKLLPRSVRDPALALYAFCRLADDEVDEGDNKARAVLDLQERLDLVYAGTPRNAPEDRAFAACVKSSICRALCPKPCLRVWRGTRLNGNTTALRMCADILRAWRRRWCDDVRVDARARCGCFGAGL